MVQQGKLLLVLELFIGPIIVAYFWIIRFAERTRSPSF